MSGIVRMSIFRDPDFWCSFALVLIASILLGIEYGSRTGIAVMALYAALRPWASWE